RRQIEQRPFEPMPWQCDELARLVRPMLARKVRKDLLARAVLAPARLRKAIAGDRDDVNERTALDRIVHEMRPPSEPQMHRGRAEFFRHGSRRDQRAPGGAVAELRLRAPAEPGAQRRPKAVGADERDALLVRHLWSAPAGHADTVRMRG